MDKIQKWNFIISIYGISISSLSILLASVCYNAAKLPIDSLYFYSLFILLFSFIVSVFFTYKWLSSFALIESSTWIKRKMSWASNFVFIANISTISSILLYNSLPTGGQSGFFFLPFICISTIFYFFGFTNGLQHSRKAPNK